MRKVVLVSLDAMFEEDWNDEGKIKGFLEDAAGCKRVKTVFPALTYPAHTTLITGCTPAEHGVGQNQPFQPGKAAEMRAWYWERAQVRRETLFDAVCRAGGRCASILWPVTGKHPAIRWNFPEVLALPGENQVLKMLRYGTAPWILRMELKHGRERVSIHEPHLSDYAVVLAQDVIRAHQPELTAIHLVDVDETRHHTGVHSPETAEAKARMGRRVAALWQTIRETPGMEDALMVLVSDHGQADVSKTVCLTDYLAAHGLADAARVQSNGMSAYLFPGKKTERAEALLREAGAAAGVSHVYSRAELNALGCVPEVAFAVEAAPEVVFSDGLPQAKREKATHGFGPGHPAENCLFAVRGRGVRAGVWLPEMAMRDVAPTVAALMGVPLPEATGTDQHGLLV